jgi:tetratricopeptide (TPR) repeat protein
MVALQRALEVDPRYTPALVNLANFMFPRADIAAAERCVRRAAEIDPQSTFTMAWVADLAALTGREDEALALLQRVLELSQTSYYLTAVYSMRTRIHLGRGDLAVAAAAVREGLAEGARPEDMRAGEAAVAAREGRLDEARRIVRELDGLAGLDLHSLALAIEASVLSGDIPLALRFLAMPQIGRDGPVLARMVPAFHPLLDQRPLAPRRLDAALVWPLEAPMIRPSVHALFREVRIESGRPPTSEVRPSTA